MKEKQNDFQELKGKWWICLHIKGKQSDLKKERIETRPPFISDNHSAFVFLFVLVIKT